MKTYVLQAELEQDGDGRWSAWVDALPGCTTWGYTKDEALSTLQVAAEMFIEDMLESGEEIPAEVQEVNEASMVTLTV